MRLLDFRLLNRLRLNIWWTVSRLPLDGPPQSGIVPQAQYRRGQLRVSKSVHFVLVSPLWEGSWASFRYYTDWALPPLRAYLAFTLHSGRPMKGARGGDRWCFPLETSGPWCRHSSTARYKLIKLVQIFIYKVQQRIYIIIM